MDLYQTVSEIDESIYLSGPNAIRALEGLGVLEAVMGKSDTKEPTLRSFIFVSGPGQHEIIYDVRGRCNLCCSRP